MGEHQSPGTGRKHLHGLMEDTRSVACLSESLWLAVQQWNHRGILQRDRDRSSRVGWKLVQRDQYHDTQFLPGSAGYDANRGCVDGHRNGEADRAVVLVSVGVLCSRHPMSSDGGSDAL